MAEETKFVHGVDEGGNEALTMSLSRSVYELSQGGVSGGLFWIRECFAEFNTHTAYRPDYAGFKDDNETVTLVMVSYMGKPVPFFAGYYPTVDGVKMLSGSKLLGIPGNPFGSIPSVKRQFNANTSRGREYMKNLRLSMDDEFAARRFVALLIRFWRRYPVDEVGATE